MTPQASPWKTPNGKPIYELDQWSPSIGGQVRDGDVPHFYSVFLPGSTMAWCYSGAPRAYALSKVGGWARFEVHSGDMNFADIAAHHPCERCELMTRDLVAKVGETAIETSTVIVEAGPPSTAAWLVLDQYHQNIDKGAVPGSPPIEFGLLPGDIPTFVVRWGKNGNDGQAGNSKTVWKGSKPIVRGAENKLTILAKIGPEGSVFATLNGETVCDHHGPVGYDGMTGVYNARGIYRAHSPEPMVVLWGAVRVLRAA